MATRANDSVVRAEILEKIYNLKKELLNSIEDSKDKNIKGLLELFYRFNQYQKEFNDPAGPKLVEWFLENTEKIAEGMAVEKSNKSPKFKEAGVYLKGLEAELDRLESLSDGGRNLTIYTRLIRKTPHLKTSEELVKEYYSEAKGQALTRHKRKFKKALDNECQRKAKN